MNHIGAIAFGGSSSHKPLEVKSYILGFQKEIRLGTPSDHDFVDAPDLPVRFVQLQTNVFWYGCILITQVMIRNTNQFKGEIDAYHWRNKERIADEIVTPAERIHLSFRYNGRVPPRHQQKDEPYTVTFELTGFYTTSQ